MDNKKTEEKQLKWIGQTGLCPECGRKLEGRILIRMTDHEGNFLGFMCSDKELHKMFVDDCREKHLIPDKLIECFQSTSVFLHDLVEELRKEGFEDKYIDAVIVCLPSVYNDVFKRFKKHVATKER